MELRRAELRLTTGAVTATMGVMPKNWWNWAGGKAEIGWSNAIKLANALRCSLDFLAGREQTEFEKTVRDQAFDEFLRLESVEDADKQTLASIVFHGRRPSPDLYRAIHFMLRNAPKA